MSAPRRALAILALLLLAGTGCRRGGAGESRGAPEAGILLDAAAPSAPAAPSPPATWVDVAVGREHTCGVQSDGSLWCWGDNTWDELGLGASESGAKVTRPTRIGAGGDWLSVAAGDTFTCGLRADKSLWCMGSLGGPGGAHKTSTPKRLGGEDLAWSGLSAGGAGACALRDGGALFCWGPVASHEASSPEAVSPGERFRAVTLGAGHACALRADDSLRCWGANPFEELGPSTDAHARDVRWKAASAGRSRTCAVRADESLWCWGHFVQDLRGRAPLRLGEGTRWTSVALGDGGGPWALDEAGALWWWGRHGMSLPAGGKAPPPVRAGEGISWKRLAVSGHRVCGVDTRGALFCWESDEESPGQPRRIPVGGAMEL